jgi:hypothetical protein
MLGYLTIPGPPIPLYKPIGLFGVVDDSLDDSVDDILR